MTESTSNGRWGVLTVEERWDEAIVRAIRTIWHRFGLCVVFATLVGPFVDVIYEAT